MTRNPTTPLPMIAREIETLRSIVAGWRRARARIALVPTMGALHDGHLALVRAARRHAERVVVSIFVNPAQFGPTEDLAKYPRTLAADRALLADLAVDLIWAPDPATMYPPGFATQIVPAGAALGLEADFRPHFFAGVATVCTKLFTQVAPDCAVFGEKDWQQLAVVRQLVRDLDLPLTIIGLPTVREADGLAMSSRNRYLSAPERTEAAMLHGALRRAQAAIRAGSDAAAACAEAAATLSGRQWRVDYVAARDAETLREMAPAKPGRLLAAAWLGTTRLIDNVAV